jgi:sensor histidine kinase YesM
MEDEARYTEQYLKLMKARYAEMFTYEVQIEESVRDISVPKLVIQPLCENCFKHGFANIEPPYRIQAWIRSEEHGWSVEVRDNGKGFSADERALLISKTEEADIETLSDMQIGGLGVFSSIVRTRIVTGKKVTCEITDIFPKGACVKLNVFDG